MLKWKLESVSLETPFLRIFLRLEVHDAKLVCSKVKSSMNIFLLRPDLPSKVRQEAAVSQHSYQQVNTQPL